MLAVGVVNTELSRKIESPCDPNQHCASFSHANGYGASYAYLCYCPMTIYLDRVTGV